MDALVPAFLAALLAECGDRTQLLAGLLSQRYRRDGMVFAAVALAALVNGLIAAAAGRLLHDIVNFRALTLLLALALIMAGAGTLLRQKPVEVARYGRAGPFLTSVLACLILGFGDKTQFLTLAIAGRADSLWLAGLGGAAGTILAAAPAIALRGTLAERLPLRALRLGAGLLLLLAGAIAAVDALRLI